MEIKPIKNTRDYRRALKEIEGLMHAKRNTPAGDRLDVLVVLVEAWEARHYRLDLPDPIPTDENGGGPGTRLRKGLVGAQDVAARTRPLSPKSG